MIFKELAKKHGLDERIIKEICNSPFKFAKKVCQDEEDRKPMRFKYLFSIALRHQFEDDKNKKHTPRVHRVSNE